MDRLVIVAKGFLKLPNLHKLIKQKNPSLPKNLALETFGELLIVFSTKVEFLFIPLCIPPLFSTPEVLCSASDEAKLCAKNFSKISNLEDSGISFPAYPSRTNLKVHNMIKKVIANLDVSNSSGPDCIPVVVLKNCKPELSYILAELFNVHLKESCFPDCWNVSSLV